jgi:MFS family permease
MVTMQQSTRPRLVSAEFVRLGLAALAYFFADGVLLPTVPLYVDGPLGAGDIAVGLAVGAFSATALVLRPWAGRIADRSGRRLLMIIGAGAFAVSVAAYGLADGVPVLVGLRLLTGVGEAFFFVGAVTAMSDLAPAERRGEAISLFSLSLYVGIALGPPAGEAVAGRFGFPAAWLLASAAAVTALLLARRVGGSVDAGLDAAVHAPGRLIHPAGVLPGVLLLTAIWGMAGFLAFVPLYALDQGLAGSGLLLFLFAGIVVVIRAAGARLPDRLGAVRATRAALASITLGLAIIGAVRSPAGLVAGTVVLAVGVALATPAIMMLALQDVPANERGSVMGTVSMSLDLAFGLGPATLGVVAAATGRGGLFLVAAGVAALGLTLVLASTRLGSAATAALDAGAQPT